MTVREQLAELVATLPCSCHRSELRDVVMQCPRCLALARHSSEPDDRPRLLALLNEALCMLADYAKVSGDAAEQVADFRKRACSDIPTP